MISFYTEITKNKENIEQESKLQNELDALQRKKDKLLDLALDGLLSKENLATKKTSIEKQIEEIKAKLKEIESKKTKTQEPKEYKQKLKENILKELEINQENLENYIDELLDKIIVTEKDNEVELKIILAGNNLITYGSATKFGKVSQMRQNKVADNKKLPLCHFHAHSNHLFT